MPRLPYKFLLFVTVGGFFYLYGLPKRAHFALGALGKAKSQNREQNLKTKVIEKVESDICTVSDLCEYRPIGWTEFSAPDTMSASIIHEFYSDEKKRKFLFRMRKGSITEVIDMN